MTSDEQLSAIEAKVDAWGKSTAIYFPPPNHLTLAESRWLIARVRELEAQAAVDARVREAVGAVPQLLWYEALAYLAGGMRRENVPNRENIDQRLCAAINAALAEREGKGE
jgi:hypothetical protein